jgi:hypothetical protein
MNRKLKLVIALLATGAVTGGVAAAASSPSVSTSSATSVKTRSVVLRGKVNANGASTTYQFVWGLAKDVYGAASPVKSAGHGTGTRTVAVTAAGLQPGTVYHYRLTATSRFGNTAGADRTVKTKGHPPPQAATGAVSALTAHTATLTGVVNPQGELTSYYFQYGPSPAYGFQTSPQLVAAGTAPVAVAQTLAGLQAFTTFHYRLVAQHGTFFPSAGVDQSFVTFAAPRFGDRVRAHTTPGRDRFAPYVFTTSGSIRLPRFLAPSLGCSGHVTVRYFFRGRDISFALVPVQPNCTFASQAVFQRLPGRGQKHRIVHLRVRIFFRGNGYVRATAARPEGVTLGRR